MDKLFSNKTLIIFFLISLSISIPTYAYATTTLILSPTSGPIGTTVTASGIGFTPTNSSVNNTLSQIQSNHRSGWFGVVNLQEWTSLPAGKIINKMSFAVRDLGQSIVTATENFGGHSERSGWFGAVNVQQYSSLPPNAVVNTIGINVTDLGNHNFIANNTNLNGVNGPWNGAVLTGEFSLPAGTLIDSVGLNIGSYTVGVGQVRIKIYDDNGTSGKPGNLLGETVPILIPGTGIQYFDISGANVKVPSDGNIWAGFETDDSAATFYNSNGAGVNADYYKTHLFNNGPNPFGTPGGTTYNFDMHVKYHGVNPHFTFKIYDDTGASGKPGVLLNETGSMAVSSIGLRNFTIPQTTIPDDGVLWIGFDTDSSTMHIGASLFLNTGYYQLHTFDVTGPSPYGTPGGSQNPIQELIQYQGKTPHIRVKLYNDNATAGKPGNLIGETGIQTITGTGWQNFTVATTIPSNGNVWAGFQTDSGSLDLNASLSSATGYYKTHIWGIGPDPLGTPTGSQNPISELLSYFVNGTASNIEMAWDGNPLTITPNPKYTNSTGGFKGVTFVAPSSLIGVHSVEVADSFGKIALKNFTITSGIIGSSGPAVAISPISGKVGSFVTMYGVRFNPSDFIHIKYDGTLVKTTTSNSFETFNDSFKVPSSTFGPHTVNASDSSGNYNFTTYHVLSDVNISPTSGSHGQIINVNGNGFNGSSTIHIYFNNALMTTSPATVTTNSTGSFSGVTIRVPILGIGNYDVKARDAGGNQDIKTYHIIAQEPGAPTLGALAESQTVIRLISVANATSGSNPVKDYSLRCSLNGGAMNTIVINSTIPINRIYDYSGLGPDDSLSCQWRDGSLSGWSDWSNIATATTKLPITQTQRAPGSNPLFKVDDFFKAHGGIYFGFSLIPLAVMLLGLLATPKTTGIFTIVSLAAMAIIHNSGLYVYPTWYWAMSLLLGVVLILSRANRK